MTKTRELEEYRCDRADLFEKLKEGAWFHNFVDYQFKRVIFDMEPVYPELSDYWISQAHYRWTKDIDLVSNKELKGKQLDHFKHAGFLCYWLRRCPPLTDLYHNPDLVFAGVKLRDPNSTKQILTRYGNAYASFDIGLRICRYWESIRTDIKYDGEVRQRLKTFTIPLGSEYIEDACYTLAEKNISPHSLNMLYKSLFMGFRPAAG